MKQIHENEEEGCFSELDTVRLKAQREPYPFSPERCKTSGTDPTELKIHGRALPFLQTHLPHFSPPPISSLSHILSGKAKINSLQNRSISFFILIFPFFLFLIGDHLGAGRGKEEALEFFRHNKK